MIDVLELMNESFIPMALITGVALIILGANERYSSVMNRIRNMHREIFLGEINENLVSSYRRQISTLILMAKILRNGLLSLYFSVFFAVVSSISIVISFLYSVNVEGVVLINMILSLISVFLGAIFIILHIILSLRALEIDLKSM
ncbi:MAG: DUF2721 domain-containing protein [Thermoplasmatales archaeon]